MNFWRTVVKLLRGNGVRCDVCGKTAYPLKWGGLLHISRNGTRSVHAIHYIRHGRRKD